MKVAVIIPAFRPAHNLVDLVEALAGQGLLGIILVDDGSGSEHRAVFDACERLPGVSVLRHAVNLGKGAALKTGMNHALCVFEDCAGVVTADADGQHLPDDILKVARRLEEPSEHLVLGVRSFDRDVPLRSRIGNIFTRHAVRLLLGTGLDDTQTGLRGIPRRLLPQLLRVPSNGYEFELEMLIACKHHHFPVIQESISTVYLADNRSSHFNPLRDSLRIYFVLLRFGALSLLTAIVDNVAFAVTYGWLGTILGAQIVGRSLAVLFNYNLARSAVFLSQERHRILLPRYLSLVAASGLVSYASISLLTALWSIKVLWAKVAVESALFVVNFLVQRDLVFRSNQAGQEATDWDRYYRSTPFTARLTRQYTTSVLVSALKRYSRARDSRPLSIVELGGANSCFLDRILEQLRPAKYHVLDNNEYGLDLLRRRTGNEGRVVLHHQDVLRLSLDTRADVAFSVGLVEHFDISRTRQAVRNHFELVRDGGLVILSFPTPTLLYRIARAVTEQLRLWKFPDERPLEPGEVLDDVKGLGQVLFEKTLWPLVFTQHFMVFRKIGADSVSG